MICSSDSPASPARRVRLPTRRPEDSVRAFSQSLPDVMGPVPMPSFTRLPLKSEPDRARSIASPTAEPTNVPTGPNHEPAMPPAMLP